MRSSRILPSWPLTWLGAAHIAIQHEFTTSLARSLPGVRVVPGWVDTVDFDDAM